MTTLPANTAVDITRPKKKSVTRDHLENRSGERNKTVDFMCSCSRVSGLAQWKNVGL